MNINAIVDGLISREGGFVNNPADRGGPTNYGITEQVARAYGYQGDMFALPLSLAQSIYRSMYWARPCFPQISLEYPTLAAYLMDTSVNQGVKTACIYFQRVLNVLNRNATDYPDVKADGDIGPLTLAAFSGYYQHRGSAGEQELLVGVQCLRGARYIEIAEGDPTQEQFEFGWLDRAAVAP